MTPGSLTKQAQDNPDAELYVHPECGCATSALYLTGTGAVPADRVKILSTDGMLDAARASMSKQVLVATEVGMLHQLRRAAPEVDFRAVNERASCRYIEDAALSLVSHAMLAAAGSRTESRGCHVRTDHPHTDDVRQRVSLMVDLDPRGRPTVRPANVARHQAA